MNDTEPSQIAAIILSGGAGSRMSGVDKGLQQHNGEALISWVIKAIRPQVGKIILSINRNQSHYDKFGLETVTDNSNQTTEKIYNGPIAGIVSSVKTINLQSYQSILIASCDSPNLNNNYIAKLNKAIIESNADVAVVNDGIRDQNLHCLIKVDVINNLLSYYQDSGRSMRGWLQTIDLIRVDFSDYSDSFANLNTMKDIST